MTKNLQRVLACALAAALLISCCISGLILPAAAEDGGTTPSATIPTNLFPGGDFENDELNAGRAWEIEGFSSIDPAGGVDGSKALKLGTFSGTLKGVTPTTITPTETLKAGKTYIVSFLKKGGVTQLYWGDGKILSMYANVDPNNWIEMRGFLTPATDMPTIEKFSIISRSPDVETWIDNIRIYEYKDGMNVIPGSDGSALPSVMATHFAGTDADYSMFGDFLAAGATLDVVTDPADATNKAWKLANISGTGYLSLNFQKFSLAENTVLKVSLRFKSAADGTDASFSLDSSSNAVKLGGYVTDADKDGWKTSVTWLRAIKDKANQVNTNYVLRPMFNTPSGILMDDFTVVKTSETVTEIKFAKDEYITAPGEKIYLAPIGKVNGEWDANAFCGNLNWVSSNEAVATVNSSGFATVTGNGVEGASALITAGDSAGTMSASVSVKVDYYKDMFIDGTLDTDTAEWQDVLTSSEHGSATLAEGKGVDGTDALHFQETNEGNNAAIYSYMSKTSASTSVSAKNYNRFKPYVLPNREYKLSFKIKGTAKLRFWLDGADGVTFKTAAEAKCYGTYEDWTLMESTLVAGPNAKAGHLCFCIDGVSDFYMDDFSCILQPEPESLDITQASALLGVGESIALTCTVKPLNSKVEWTSDNTGVATVDKGTGKVTAVGLGTATITAKSAEGKTDTCLITVAGKATSLSVQPGEVTLAPQATTTLKAAPVPAGSTAGAITWASSDESIAAVDAETGVVTAVKGGTVTITATGSGGSAKGTCTVTVDEYANLLVAGDFESAAASQSWGTTNATIIAEPGNEENHVWAFGPNPNVAYFWHKNDGYLAKLPIEANQTYVFSGRVKGKNKPGIYFNPSVVYKLDGTGAGWQYPSKSDDEWTSFEFVVKTKADAQGKGFLSFVNAGAGGVCYFDDLKLCKRVPPALTGITLTPEDVTYGIGVTKQLTVTEAPEDALLGNLTWKSSDTAVATVDENGKLTTVGVGTATITAESDKGFSDTCTVKVVQYAETFKLAKSELSLLPNITQTLHVVATPVGATPVGTLQWSSDNTAVATVNNGVVTAVADGTATITVTNGTVTQTCVVKVSEYGNMIVGGDFEDETWPGNWDAVLAGDKATKGDDDTNDANHTLLVKAGQTTGWYNGLTLENDEIYRVTGLAKGYVAQVNVSGAAQGIVMGDGNHATASASNFTEWTEFTFVFKTAKTGTISGNTIFRFVGNQLGDTYFDDISLVKLPKLTGISLPPTDAVVPENSFTLKVVPIPADAYIEETIQWSSTDSTIAAVDSQGKVSGIKEGKVTITATVQNFTAQTELEVDYYAPLIRNSDFEGDLTGLYTNTDNFVKGAGENGGTAFVISGNTGFSYSPEFMLFPLNQYIVTIRYKTDSNIPYNDSRFWGKGMGGIRFENTKGQWVTKTLNFQAPSDWKPEEFGSELSVLGSEALSEEARIYIDSIDIRMYDTGVEVESIVLSPNPFELMPGAKKTLLTSYKPGNANSNFMVWASSNDNVATVSNGIVTAVGGGEAKITVRAANGVIGEATVKVVGNEAYLKNGTFDLANDTTSWTLAGSAAVQAGVGINKTNALAVNAGGTASQVISGLKAGTTYQLMAQFYTPNGGAAKLTLTKDGAADPLAIFTTGSLSAWNAYTYLYTTPSDFEGDLTVTIATNTAAGTAYLDNIMLIEGYSEADLIVSDLIWNDGETEIKTGTPLNFTVVVANIGSEDTKASQPIRVEIRANGKVIRVLSLLGGVKAGNIEVLVTDANDAWIATEGDLTLAAVVNTDMSVLEKDRTNNGFQLNARVADKPLDVPEVAMNAGMNKLVFSDDFSTLDSIDQSGSSEYGYKWYIYNNDKISFISKNGYELTEDGMLLKANAESGEYGLYNLDYNTFAGWDGFQFGYMECRVRMPHTASKASASKGPAIWSLPPERLKNTSNVRWVEMDWMEYWGDEYGKMHWTITMHDQSTGDMGQINYWEANSNYGITGDEKDIGDNEWHVLGYVWDRGYIKAYLDGTKIFEHTWSAQEGPNPIPRSKLGDAEMDVFTIMDTRKLPLIIAAYDGWEMELDYIRIWQSDGTVEPEPEVNEEFVNAFLKEENGTLIKDVTVDNYESIIGAADDWGKLTEEEQALINKLLTDNGGKDFNTLLYDAQYVNLFANNFVSFYACAESGEPYTEVNEDNREWILSSLPEWEALTDLQRAVINAKVLKLCGMTFDELLSAAENFGKKPSPESGVPFPAVALVGLLLGGSAVIGSRKRREK